MWMQAGLSYWLNPNLKFTVGYLDFGIGRDFGLGSNAMWTLGVRVADLRSKLNGNFNISTVGPAPSPTTIAIQEKSTFVGAGPRFGVQGVSTIISRRSKRRLSLAISPQRPPTVTTTNIDRSYSGPVVRLTSKF
jgi:hypothetical protein